MSSDDTPSAGLQEMINKVKWNFGKFFDDIHERGKTNIAKYDTTVESAESSSSSHFSKNSDYNNELILSGCKHPNKLESETLRRPSEVRRISFMKGAKEDAAEGPSKKVTRQNSQILGNQITSSPTLVRSDDTGVDFDEFDSKNVNMIQFLIHKYTGPVNYETLPDKKLARLSLCEQRIQTDTTINSFLISSLNFSLGLGNFWRFPLKCIEGGGASFLIAYGILFIVVAVPIFFFEMALGQFAGRGIVGAYNFSPVAKGVGITNLCICLLMNTYYNALLSWSLLYMSYSIYGTTPWAKCDNDWNVQPCVNIWNSSEIGKTFSFLNDSQILASNQFFYGYVLNLGDKHQEGIRYSINNLNPPNWYAVLCSFISWLLIFLTVVCDFEAADFAKHLTVFTPFVVMYILLMITATLPRAKDGLYKLFVPELNRLLRPVTWIIALEQALYTLTICSSLRTVKSSTAFNNFHVNFYNDLVLILTGNIFISILSGLITFQMLGYVAPGVGLDDLPSDPGLIFQFMSESTVELGKVFGNIFSFLFFLIFFLVGINTQSGLTRCVITFIVNEFPSIFKNKLLHKALLILFTCVFGFCLGMPFITPEGYFWFLKIDFEAIGKVIIVCAFTKICIVVYIYGWKNLCEDIFMMINYKANKFWILTWTFTCPICLFIFCILQYVFQNTFETEYKRLSINYNETKWTEHVTLSISTIILLQIIIIPIIILCLNIASYRDISFPDRIKWLFGENILWGPQKKSNWLLNRRYKAKLRKYDRIHIG